MARPKVNTEPIVIDTVGFVEKQYITISPFYTKYNDKMVTYKKGDLAVGLKPETLQSCIDKKLVELVK